MKAWGLTCSIPCDKCDKNCPYCISEMTGFVKPNPELVVRNMEKVYTTAKNSQILTVILTSKREPTLNMEAVLKMSNRFKEYPVEVQTNGIQLNKKPELLKELFKNGVSVIAFSIDNLKQLRLYKDLFKEIQDIGMIVRVCLNLTDMISVEMKFMDIFSEIEKTNNVSQLLVRNVSIPTNITSGKQYNWIDQHVDPERYLKWAQEFDRVIIKESKKPVRTLDFDGSKVWSHNGISILFSDYCIQETNNTVDVRSLIFLEDGHLYTSWSDPASILF